MGKSDLTRKKIKTFNYYKVLDDYYMKEPSKFVMAKQLLNKEMLMNLPKMYSGDEGKEIADKIIKFIDDAFNSAN